MPLGTPRAIESDALLSLLSFCYPGNPNLPKPYGQAWNTLPNTAAPQTTNAVTGWSLITKFDPRLWAEVNRADKPCLFLTVPKDRAEPRGSNLQRRVRMYQAWIYLRVDAAADSTKPICNVVDDVWDAIDWGLQTLLPNGNKNVLSPRGGTTQTLQWNYDFGSGLQVTNLVSDVWVEGDRLSSLGIIDKQNISVSVPIFTRTGNP